MTKNIFFENVVEIFVSFPPFSWPVVSMSGFLKTDQKPVTVTT